MSSVSRGRPRTEAATPPMIAPSAAAESSHSETAPSAWTSGDGGSCRPPADLLFAKRGPSQRHPPRPHRVVLLVKRPGPPHFAGGLHQAGQLTQLGLHRGGSKLFAQPRAGNCPAFLVPGSVLGRNRLGNRSHVRHCIEGGVRAPNDESKPVGSRLSAVSGSADPRDTRGPGRADRRAGRRTAASARHRISGGFGSCTTATPTPPGRCGRSITARRPCRDHAVDIGSVPMDPRTRIRVSRRRARA